MPLEAFIMMAQEKSNFVSLRLQNAHAEIEECFYRSEAFYDFFAEVHTLISIIIIIIIIIITVYSSLYVSRQKVLHSLISA